MANNIIISSLLHLFLIIITALSLPFLAKKPIDLPPIISIELIQITDKTSIPYAPKAKKIIEEIKKKEKEKLVSEQAPPKKVKKEKPDAIPLPDQQKNIVKNQKRTNKTQKRSMMKLNKFQNLKKKNYLIQTILLH